MRMAPSVLNFSEAQSNVSFGQLQLRHCEDLELEFINSCVLLSTIELTNSVLFTISRLLPWGKYV